MKKLLYIFLFPVFFLCFVLQDDFSTLLNRNRMQFYKPKGMKEIKPVNNVRMRYEKAYKHRKKKFEVRYAIRPFDKLFEEYKRSKKDSFAMLDPNSLYKTSFTVTFMNVSDGRDYPYSILDSTTVKKEFNADWGATTTVETGADFGMGYRYCMLVYIFKKDVGEGYYFYLADDKKLLSELMSPIARTLMFKK